METLNAIVLNEKFGSVILPTSTVEVPMGWFSAVDTMLDRLAKLPTDIRAFLVVVGIYPGDDGLLHVDLVAHPKLEGSDGWATVEGIIRDAQDLAAWSCVNDGEEGWIVSPSKGMPRPLCPDCQYASGMKGIRHDN
jgi:hypothetical protein